MRLGRSSEGFAARCGELCTNTGAKPQLVGITLDLLAKALAEGTLDFVPDHILLDEAAYAPLVKALPLLTYRTARVTMLGDHHQLPPVCDPKVQRCRGNRSLWLWQHSAVELGAIFGEPIWRPGRLRITNSSVAALIRSYRFGTELASYSVAACTGIIWWEQRHIGRALRSSPRRASLGEPGAVRRRRRPSAVWCQRWLGATTRSSHPTMRRKDC